jgi:hypothetical protein
MEGPEASKPYKKRPSRGTPSPLPMQLAAQMEKPRLREGTGLSHSPTVGTQQMGPGLRCRVQSLLQQDRGLNGASWSGGTSSSRGRRSSQLGETWGSHTFSPCAKPSHSLSFSQGCLQGDPRDRSRLCLLLTLKGVPGSVLLDWDASKCTVGTAAIWNQITSAGAWGVRGPCLGVSVLSPPTESAGMCVCGRGRARMRALAEPAVTSDWEDWENGLWPQCSPCAGDLRLFLGTLGQNSAPPLTTKGLCDVTEPLHPRLCIGC